MSLPCDIGELEAIVCRWPDVNRRETKSQIVLSHNGANFCWLSPATSVVQIAPSIGRQEKTRRLERHGARVKVIRQRTGDIEAEYNDPGLLLGRNMWSYPGFACSQVTQDEAESLVRQAYEQAQDNSDARIPRTPSPRGEHSGDSPSPSPKVIQVPMEKELVQALDTWSRKLDRSRADIIRDACRHYLKQVEREELDRIYREGYDLVPEEPIMALTQAALLGQVLPKEEW